MKIPFEIGNGNRTTEWAECIAFYQELARSHPNILHFAEHGLSDGGFPMHFGVISANGEFDPGRIKAAGRTVFFNNNGIHPGEPEGIDACMALVRDFCESPARLAALGDTVFLFQPIYNVDGCNNRADTSRVNQIGPELFGFRGNARNLDLNRDFVKCDSLAAQNFNRLFVTWDPDVMVDTHTSNGADYPYVMTLIHTQPDKLGHHLGGFLRQTMLPSIYAAMGQRGWPTCPYVNPVQDSPDQGIADFLETPRFSTGYAALHHTIGFMPETHMLKPFDQRYLSTRALVEEVLAFTIEHGAEIRALRRQARDEDRKRNSWPIHWRMEEGSPSRFRFKGYKAVRQPSKIGNYQRLAYDRSAPWEAEIPYFDRFGPDILIEAPCAYVLPQAWREVAERLRWNGATLERIDSESTLAARVRRIRSVTSRVGAYEGHMFHDEVTMTEAEETILLRPGDYWIPLDQDRARYIVETLEPEAHDSFFRWGFFNAVLEKKENYSDYVFEDLAEEMLRDEPALNSAFEAWKSANPASLSDQKAVLDFLFAHCRRHAEPEWRRYPVFSITDPMAYKARHATGTEPNDPYREHQQAE